MNLDREKAEVIMDALCAYLLNFNNMEDIRVKTVKDIVKVVNLLYPDIVDESLWCPRMQEVVNDIRN